MEVDVGGVKTPKQQGQSSRKEFKESREKGKKQNKQTNERTKSLLIKTQLKRVSDATKKSILVFGI